MNTKQTDDKNLIIRDFKSYKNHFEEIGLDEPTFNSLNKIVQDIIKNMPNPFMKDEMRDKEEKKLFTDLLLNK